MPLNILFKYYIILELNSLLSFKKAFPNAYAFSLLISNKIILLTISLAAIQLAKPHQHSQHS
ncbi:hypothetical protein ACWNYW_00170 [Candidatus Karelsulcia muelleri]